MEASMKLICYTFDGKSVDVAPAASHRQWVDDTKDQFANRCLPLVAANSHGWQILGQDGCWIKWSGGAETKHLKVKTDSGTDEHVLSHFGHGIVTFRVHCLLRTEPGINLWLTGPTNSFKQGIQAMTGVLETDWMPYNFTMNWQITRKRKWIRFEKGEPIAQFFPVPRNIVDKVDPTIRPLSSEPELCEMTTAWLQSKTEFNKALANHDALVTQQAWQKHYFQGVYPDGTQTSADHQTKIRAKPFQPS